MLRGAIGQVSPVDDEYAELGWVYKSEYWPVSIDLSKQEVIADSMSARVLITYLAVYIGFVLLIATAAVLVLVVYGGYLLVIYFGCREMVRSSLGKHLLEA
mgnify:CR=1 FL=1